MCVRRDGGPWDVPEGLTLREWSRELVPRPPTREDLDYHLTTLFPPVRPRGHLELRMIDAQPGDDGWIVPLAVTAALFDDPEATETAYRAVKPWRSAPWACPRRTIRCTRTRPVTPSPIPSCARRPSRVSPRHSPRCPGSARAPR